MSAVTDLRATITRDYLAGMPAKAIAEHYGLPLGSVQASLSAWGVRLSSEERGRRMRGVVGRRAVWADCPKSLRPDYDTLRRYMPAREARATLEAGL